jgi:hypothetical protein
MGIGERLMSIKRILFIGLILLMVLLCGCIDQKPAENPIVPITPPVPGQYNIGDVIPIGTQIYVVQDKTSDTVVIVPIDNTTKSVGEYGISTPIKDINQTVVGHVNNPVVVPLKVVESNSKTIGLSAHDPTCVNGGIATLFEPFPNGSVKMTHTYSLKCYGPTDPVVTIMSHDEYTKYISSMEV